MGETYFVCDIYNLGLILFDLAYPCNDDKSIEFKEIKKRSVPFKIKEQSPIIYRILELMLSENSKKRPSTKKIIMLIKEYLKSLKEYNKPKKNFNRRRFQSEDIQCEKKFEINLKLDEQRNQDWKSMYI